MVVPGGAGNRQNPKIEIRNSNDESNSKLEIRNIWPKQSLFGHSNFEFVPARRDSNFVFRA